VALVEDTQSFTGTLLTQIDGESVADSETDYEIVVALDVSAIQAIIITSDQDVTLETNSGAAPDDTIALTANNPYVWYTGSYYTNLLTTDITSIFITNASGSTATIDVLALVDATP
jgi:hypothetical protein